MLEAIPRYLVIAGPTASGKSSLAMKIAKQYRAEIISCDSVQLYQGFDIGSAKPTVSDQKLIGHHLIDCLSWDQDCDARKYSDWARSTIKSIAKRGRLPIVVGGTGLYLRALWQQNWHDLPKSESVRQALCQLTNEELHHQLTVRDPKRALAIHPNDRLRLIRANEIYELTGQPVPTTSVEVSAWRAGCLAIHTKLPRSVLHERIAARARQMLQEGLVEEVRFLLSELQCHPSCKPLNSIGYKQVVEFLNEGCSEEQLLDNIIFATRQYAKRQETWFRKVAFDCSYIVGESASDKALFKHISDFLQHSSH